MTELMQLPRRERIKLLRALHFIRETKSHLDKIEQLVVLVEAASHNNCPHILGHADHIQTSTHCLRDLAQSILVVISDSISDN